MNASRKELIVMDYPSIIQGGMGIAVSDWSLARAVSQAGQLGVVSGTGIWLVVTRRLQDGDPGGHIRRAAAHFPVPAIAEAILNRYYIAGGKAGDAPYRLTPMLTHPLSPRLSELIVFSNFITVWLAREGHDGLVGVNYLEKIQLSHLPGLYGAILAGADMILMGAGIPVQLKEAAMNLAAHRPASYRLKVEGAGAEERFEATFDPASILHPEQQTPLKTPLCVAIISSNTLGKLLADCIDGFIIEGPSAGGHNAPPRSKQVGPDGEPLYGPKDQVDLARIRELGLPFWLAGSQASPRALQEALSEGAQGIQAGSIFALTRESSLRDDLKRQVIAEGLGGSLVVRANPSASPSGYPFQEAQLPGTIGAADVYESRERNCDMGCLRTLYLRNDGRIGYRCPAAPLKEYLRKGGKVEDTEGKKCLCNHLCAAVGVGQYRPEWGAAEAPLVTFGKDYSFLPHVTTGDPYPAQQAIRYLLGAAPL